MPLRRLAACRIVPSVFLLLAACFRSGSPDARPDAGGDAGPGMTCNCCGVTVSVGPGETCFGGVCDPYCGRVDAGMDLDAGPDGGFACPSEPIDVACYGFLAAGRPNVLDLLVGGDGSCYCGETIECRATVVAPGRLALETAVCPGFCEACLPFGGPVACALPELSAGPWEVWVNGDEAFTVDVAPAGVLPEWGATCHRVADDGGECGATFPPLDFPPARACAPETSFSEQRVPIRVVDGCGGCGVVAGPCRVDVFDDVIRVHAERLGTECDIACPPVCVEREDVCWTPPLPEGSYRVLFEGSTEELSIRVGSDGSGTERCVDFAP